MFNLHKENKNNWNYWKVLGEIRLILLQNVRRQKREGERMSSGEGGGSFIMNSAFRHPRENQTFPARKIRIIMTSKTTGINNLHRRQLKLIYDFVFFAWKQPLSPR